MPICITFIKVIQMHYIILLFCNKQVGLAVIIYSIYFIYAIPYGHIDNINPIHTCITLIKVM
jgi:hypothetical protein